MLGFLLHCECETSDGYHLRLCKKVLNMHSLTALLLLELISQALHYAEIEGLAIDHDGQVIYGDTDSIMIHTGLDDLAAAKNIAVKVIKEVQVLPLQ